MPVLQAYTLLLIAIRTQMDSDTLSILTGIAIRLAQRMGIYRDDENLGLPPFVLQMRRWLFDCFRWTAMRARFPTLISFHH